MKNDYYPNLDGPAEPKDIRYLHRGSYSPEASLQGIYENIIQQAIDFATAELRNQFSANEASIKRALGKSHMSYPAINAAIVAAGEIKELLNQRDQLLAQLKAANHALSHPMTALLKP